MVGLRYATHTLTDDKRSENDTYFGHVNALENESDVDLLRSLYADWYMAEWRNIDFGAGLAWTTISAETRNIEGHSDGTVQAEAPVLTAIARYPIDCSIRGYHWRFTPSAGLGISYAIMDFDHESWWHHGFGRGIREGLETESDARDDYNDWVSRGSPSDEVDYTRTIRVDDAFGWVFQLGLRASHGPLGIDLFLRHMDLDIDGSYNQDWASGRKLSEDIEYPLSHWTTGIGISYEL